MDANSVLALARDRSHTGRAALSQTVSRLLLDEGFKRKPVERRLILEILAQVVGDIEHDVRRELSQSLAQTEDAPHDLIRVLADDAIDIAFPILANSPVLTDPDLLAIIRCHAAEHQVAVASRSHINPDVSDALVAAGNVSVVRRLLENHGAVISNPNLDRLVEESRRVEIYREPLLKRPDLPPALARRMFVWVSAALRQYILDTFSLSPVLVEDAVYAAAGRVLAEGESAHERRGDLPFPVRVLIETLADGHVFQFVAMLRQLTGLREVLLLRILAEKSGEGLAVVLCAMGVDQAAYSVIFSLVRRVRSEPVIDHTGSRTGAEAFFGRLIREHAHATVAKWRQGHDYQAALRSMPAR